MVLDRVIARCRTDAASVGSGVSFAADLIVDSIQSSRTACPKRQSLPSDPASPRRRLPGRLAPRVVRTSLRANAGPLRVTAVCKMGHRCGLVCYYPRHIERRISKSLYLIYVN